MKSNELIESIISSPDFQPKPYSYAVWFLNRLIAEGFFYLDGWDKPPHYKMATFQITIIISPYPNVVIVELDGKEIHAQEGIPQDEEQYELFFNEIKSSL